MKLYQPFAKIEEENLKKIDHLVETANPCYSNGRAHEVALLANHIYDNDKVRLIKDGQSLKIPYNPARPVSQLSDTGTYLIPREIKI